MRALKLVISLIAILFFSYSAVLGEGLTLDRAKKDYSYNFSLYKSAHDKYKLEKGEYLKFKTLTSKESARKATLSMLKARETTMATYLTLLRTKLSQVSNLDPSQKSNVLTRIDSEVLWYQNQEQNYGANDELEVLMKKSAVTPTQHEENTTPLMLEARYLISKGELNLIRTKHTSLLEKLRIKTKNIEENNDKDTKLLNRWLNDIESYLTSSSTSEALAESEFDEARERSRIRTDVYLSASRTLSTALTDVAQANQFMQEIIKNIKTSDN